MVENKGLVPL